MPPFPARTVIVTLSTSIAALYQKTHSLASDESIWYSKKMQPLVIINADDFGYSEGVNKGIQKAYEEGVLTSTTVMGNVVNGTESLAFENKSGLTKPPIAHGVHLNLTYGKPLVPQAWNDMTSFTRPYKGSNTDEEWKGSAWAAYFSQIDSYAVEREFQAQIARVEELFGPVDHLDNHHGVTSYPPITDVYEKLAKDLLLPVRPISPLSEHAVYGGEFVFDLTYKAHLRKQHIKTVDHINMSYFYQDKDPVEAFCRQLTSLKSGEVAEFMFHPAIDDSQGKWRLVDLEILTHEKVKKLVTSHNITLTTYKLSAH